MQASGWMSVKVTSLTCRLTFLSSWSFLPPAFKVPLSLLHGQPHISRPLRLRNVPQRLRLSCFRGPELRSSTGGQSCVGGAYLRSWCREQWLQSHPGNQGLVGGRFCKSLPWFHGCFCFVHYTSLIWAQISLRFPQFKGNVRWWGRLWGPGSISHTECPAPFRGAGGHKPPEHREGLKAVLFERLTHGVRGRSLGWPIGRARGTASWGVRAGDGGWDPPEDEPGAPGLAGVLNEDRGPNEALLHLQGKTQKQSSDLCFTDWIKTSTLPSRVDTLH